MKITKILFITILLLCSIKSLELFAQTSTEINYESLYNQLEDLELQEIAAQIFNYTIERDVGNFYLKSGDIYLAKPIFGKEYAFLFKGVGEFSFTPPTRVEKEQLKRFFETQELVKNFSTLIVFAGDNTINQLKKDFKFLPNNHTDKFNSELEDCLEYITDDDGSYIQYSIAKTILEGNINSQFFAFIDEDWEDPVAFEINPFQVEEVRFLKPHDKHEYFETINQFHKHEDYKSIRSLYDEKKSEIDIKEYRINSIIDDGLDFFCKTKITFDVKGDSPNWLTLLLYEELEIDSIFWSNGDTVSFYRYEENPYLWIKCNPSLIKDSTYNLNIHYHGDLIDRNIINWFYIESSVNWYPDHFDRDRAIFDLTFHTPEKYTFVTIGNKITQEVKDDVVISHWITDYPVKNASFNIGVFKKHEINEKGIPPTTILISEDGHHDMAFLLGQDGILSGTDMEKQVAADIINSIAFYQELFGPCPAKRFYATEIPASHSSAFSGLIHLSWTTFQQTSQWGFDEYLRGHEVAHQWFPWGADYKTYHDRWLSEGFATYLGLWYMQFILKDNEKFFDLLNRWKSDIINNRKFLLGSGQKAGPIWLGDRNFTSETKEDYSIIVYKKGAWVLHMLRNMMIDLRTMNDDKYKNMLKNYYNTYVNKFASTVDFQRIVEKHLNKDMDWFFDQWVYGTGIPKYKFSWTSTPLKTGKYQIQCKIDQENVEKDFQMYVPIQVSFGDKGVARLRILVNGHKTDYSLPKMPFEPEEVTFNYLESVLCEVKD